MTAPTPDMNAQHAGLLATYGAALDQADQPGDPDLTVEAAEHRRQAALDAARATATSTAEQIAHAAELAEENTRKACQKWLLDPGKVDASEAAAAWQHNILPSATNGRIPWERVIATSGVAERAALLRFAPAWIRQHVEPGPAGARAAEQSIAELIEAVQRRHLVDSGSTSAAALAAHDQAEADAAHATRIAHEVRHARSRAALAGLSISVKRRQAAGQ